MIKITISNDILRRIIAIESNRHSLWGLKIAPSVINRLRKNSKKKSAYASNRIEGNPLSEEQVSALLEKDGHRHFLKPEIEIRNYFLALGFLSESLKKKAPFSKQLILDTQALVEKGASPEKIGLRGPMPPGVLFAVYDSASGRPDYIPPEHSDVPALLDELVSYVNKSDDHPLIKAGVVHYQLVTIHPFEDGNGRTARLMSGYILDYYGYDFLGIGSLDEYFAYDVDEYYKSLQMGLPALYYDGRDNPPHPEIWIDYFLRMVELYSSKVVDVSNSSSDESISAPISFLNKSESGFLLNLLAGGYASYKPAEMARLLSVNNKTIINHSAKLVSAGFLIPVLVKERITSYRLSDFALENKKTLVEMLKKKSSPIRP